MKGARKLGKMFSLKADSKGDTGIGTLIIFIALVLVAAVASTVLIHTAGVLQQRAQNTGQQTTQQVSTGLTVSQIFGINNNTANYASGYIKWAAIYVQETSGSQPVNLGNVTIQLTYKNVTASLTYIGTSAFNDSSTGTQNIFNNSHFSSLVAPAANVGFGIIVLQDPTASMTGTYPVMQYGDQVALLVNVTAVFGGTGIYQGQTVTGQVTPPSGNPGVIQFTAPESFTSQVVELQ